MKFVAGHWFKIESRDGGLKITEWKQRNFLSELIEHHHVYYKYGYEKVLYSEQSIKE